MPTYSPGIVIRISKVELWLLTIARTFRPTSAGRSHDLTGRLSRHDRPWLKAGITLCGNRRGVRNPVIRGIFTFPKTRRGWRYPWIFGGGDTGANKPRASKTDVPKSCALEPIPAYDSRKRDNTALFATISTHFLKEALVSLPNHASWMFH